LKASVPSVFDRESLNPPPLAPLLVGNCARWFLSKSLLVTRYCCCSKLAVPVLLLLSSRGYCWDVGFGSDHSEPASH